MADEADQGGTSRREALLGTVTALAALAVKWKLPLVDAMTPLVTGPRDRMAAVALNPIYQQVQRIVGPVVMSDDGKGFGWLEKDQNGIYTIMVQFPETPMEWADARERYDIKNARSWRTPEELAALVSKGGKWNIRMSTGAQFCLVSKMAALGPLKSEPIDREGWNTCERFTSDPKEAGLFSARDVIRTVPQMMAAWELDAQHPWCFEPVRPEDALKDLRYRRARTSGWAPRVYEEYDAAALRKTFGTAVTMGKRHPFTKVEDGFACLLDYGSGPGCTEFPSPDYVVWSAQCPRVEEEDHDQTCDCLPPEMRESDGTVLSHIFARAGRRGAYLYLGLGHLESRYSAVARFRIEPKVKREIYASLGGYTGWELHLQDSATEEKESVKFSHGADIAGYLQKTGTMKWPVLTLGQWGKGKLEISMAADRASIEYNGYEYGRSVRRWRINPQFSGDASDYVALEGEDGNLWSPARAVLPRAEVEAIVQAFYKGGCELPDRQLWVKNVYGKEEDEDKEEKAVDGSGAEG